jgi:hypothetical protein
MSESKQTWDSTVPEELKELSPSRLYRENSFCVLGAMTDASISDIRRSQSKLDLQKKLGINDTSVRIGVFSINPQPSREEVERSVARIGDPVNKFVDEFFWFWPLDSGLTSVEHLRGHNYRQVLDEWLTAVTKLPDNPSLVHNVAVLTHILAMDLDGAGNLWTQSLQRWKSVSDNELLWDVVRDRALAVDDPRLTSGTVRRIRKSLISFVCTCAFKHAIDLCDSGLANKAKQVVNCFYQAGIDTETVRSAAIDASNGLKSTLEAEVASSKSAYKSRPHKADELARNIYESSQGILAVLDLIFENFADTRTSYHDIVGHAIIDGASSYGEATDDWKTSKHVVLMCQKLKCSQSVMSRVSDRTEYFTSSMNSGNHWYSPGYWELQPEVIEVMERAHGKALASDYLGALEILLKLPSSVGNPLKRSVAYCLSRYSISLYNLKYGELESRAGKIMESAGGVPQDSVSIARLIQIFKEMGDVCAESASFMMLAASLDSKDESIKKNLNTITEKVKRDHSVTPKIDIAKNKISKSRICSLDHKVMGATDSSMCFFCGFVRTHNSHEKLLRLKFEKKSVQQLFGTGSLQEFVTVRIPRCESCSLQHRSIFKEVEEWQVRAVAFANRHDYAEQIHSMEGLVCDLEFKVESYRNIRNVEFSKEQEVIQEKKTELSGISADVRRIERSHTRALQDLETKRGNRNIFAKLFNNSSPEIVAVEKLIDELDDQVKAKANTTKALTAEVSLLVNDLNSKVARREQAIKEQILLLQSQLQSAHRLFRDAVTAQVSKYNEMDQRPSLSPHIKPESEYLNYEHVSRYLALGWQVDSSSSFESTGVADSKQSVPIPFADLPGLDFSKYDELIMKATRLTNGIDVKDS